eukprot:TRINITY_DN9507_c0_g3_i2.p1 TRINITY_DN9507_c0_g3~~TRINITY_DN9507_c0_g3_i2.p1  ORF type:complete len:410 (+),score=60.77 TRINITY_DN9507_c0_g3_i2:85-1314(+)
MEKLEEEKSGCENHRNHKEEVKENRAILDFRNEHNQFFLIIISRSKDEVIFSLEFPECYAYDCHCKYTLKDIARICARLDLRELLKKEVKDLKKILKFFSHKAILSIDDELDEVLHEKESVKFIEVQKGNYSIMKVIEYFYLNNLINNYKDAIELLEVIQKNAEAILDISRGIYRLKEIIDGDSVNKELKLFVLEGNAVYKLIKKIISKHRDGQELDSIFLNGEDYMRRVVKLLACELGITIRFYYRGAISINANTGSGFIEFVEESGGSTSRIFPNLEDDELTVRLVNVSHKCKLSATDYKGSCLPQVCKHTKQSLVKSHNFAREEPMSKYKICSSCNAEVTKREFVMRSSNMCMQCLMLVGLKKNRVELQCCHKFCVECFADVVAAFDETAFCLVCGVSRILCVSPV